MRQHPVIAAAMFDRDDPFIGRRVMNYVRQGYEMHDYSRSRRLPARIEDRFTLKQRKTK